MKSRIDEDKSEHDILNNNSARSICMRLRGDINDPKFKRSGIGMSSSSLAIPETDEITPN